MVVCLFIILGWKFRVVYMCGCLVVKVRVFCYVVGVVVIERIVSCFFLYVWVMVIGFGYRFRWMWKLIMVFLGGGEVFLIFL